MIVERKGYREEYLGREAIFLIPMSKLDMVFAFNLNEGMVINLIGDFLKKNYGDSWREFPHVKGFWKGMEDGPYMEIRIAFVGKGKIPKLKKFLGQLAGIICEECIYLGTGEDFWAIYSQ